MALDPIWKQQLVLVSYGNEYLSQNLSFNHWAKHAIFNQHLFLFRDLNTQHLLAQHFQVWLEGLKKQGVTKISLHNSSLLIDEKNPNPNVELLPYAHFIVSHHTNHYVAWIFGKELAEWYTAENDFEAPENQKMVQRVESLWRFELNQTQSKRVATDMQQPNWDDIHVFTDNSLFDQPIAQGFVSPTLLGQTYYGYVKAENSDENTPSKQLNLPLLPNDYNAAYAHESLIRLEALDHFLANKLKYKSDENGEEISTEESVSIRHFRQKLEDLTAKFVTKVANHYKTARLTPVVTSSALDSDSTTYKTENRFFNKDVPEKKSEHKSGKTNVFALIIITAIICVCAYYFGL